MFSVFFASILLKFGDQVIYKPDDFYSRVCSQNWTIVGMNNKIKTDDDLGSSDVSYKIKNNNQKCPLDAIWVPVHHLKKKVG